MDVNSRPRDRFPGPVFTFRLKPRTSASRIKSFYRGSRYEMLKGSPGPEPTTGREADSQQSRHVAQLGHLQVYLHAKALDSCDIQWCSFLLKL